MKTRTLFSLMLIASFSAFGSRCLTAADPQPVLDSYAHVANIDALAAELQKQVAQAKTHSFSRAWYDWELLLRRYIDEGRGDENALKMLAAYFRGAMLDRYRALEAQGEGELFYIFNTSLDGDRSRRFFEGKTLTRDVHGGGGHGGWGAHARMLIYEELVRQGVLSRQEQALFKKIVIQSLSEKFLDLNALERGANNRPYKNTGGLAAAVRIFPDMPRVDELRAWIDRQWREFTEHGDIFEVNHFPYGGLHLSGLMDIAEEAGKLEERESRELIYTVAKRYLLFNHGMGVRGNPNSGAKSNAQFTQQDVFANPWHATYYGGALIPDFWYRAAKEFEDEEFLWAAVQTSIGPKPPPNTVAHEQKKQWDAAYKRRFEWFIRRGMEPKCPAGGSSVSLLCPTKHRIKERLYLCSGRQFDKPFASFYLYDRNNEYMHCFGDAMGRLYEYCAHGAKLVGTSGKYNGIPVPESVRAEDRDGKRNWFDAPALDYAWWQQRQKRLLVYVHPAADQTYGQLQHKSTPDFSRDIHTNSSWAASIVRAGRPKVFLSALVPRTDGEDVLALLDDLGTAIDESGGVNVSVGDVNLSLHADGEWFVKR